jgi:hypothetical protein
VAEASASTPTTPIIAPKYQLIAPALSAEKPWSIMPFTASGTVSVAPEAAVSAASAPRMRPL